MVQPPSPVDHNIVLIFVQANGTADRPGRVELAKLEKSIEDWAILSDVNCDARSGEKWGRKEGRKEGRTVNALIRQSSNHMGKAYISANAAEIQTCCQG
jgi:hypothetical protein